MTLSVLLFCSVAFEDGSKCTEDTEHIEIEGAVLHIVILQFQALFIIDIGAAVAAPPAGDAGFDFLIELEAVVILQFVFYKRPRAHKAHVPYEDIQKLREFVNGRFTEKLADFGDARIVFKLLVFFPFFSIALLL